jgi:hypothetical protein
MEHYYLPFLSLFLYIITLICSSTASYKWSKVLVILYKQRSNKIQTSLSPLFNLYSAICFCYNFLLIFHCLYMVIAWRIGKFFSLFLLDEFIKRYYRERLQRLFYFLVIYSSVCFHHYRSDRSFIHDHRSMFDDKMSDALSYIKI